MIKDFRYHSTNQSIRIIKFHITWRYWFWRSRVESDSARVEIPGETVEGAITLPLQPYIILTTIPLEIVLRQI